MAVVQRWPLLEVLLYVQWDDKTSSYRPIYFGVPQGSMLGPVLFNIYVSSLPSDDTSLYQLNSIRNIQLTTKIVETNIKNLNTWSENNGSTTLSKALTY